MTFDCASGPAPCRASCGGVLLAYPERVTLVCRWRSSVGDIRLCRNEEPLAPDHVVGCDACGGRWPAAGIERAMTEAGNRAVTEPSP